MAAFIGVLIAGNLSDRLALRFWGSRMVLQGAGLLGGAVFLFFMGGKSSLGWLYVMFAGWGFFRAFFDANTYAVLYDVTPSRLHASCSSAMITTGFAVGALAPVVLGALKQTMGSLSAAFPVLALIWAVAGGMVLIVALTCYKNDCNKIHK